MELFTNTIYFFRNLNSINIFFLFLIEKLIINKKTLLVVVIVGTVEFLKLQAYLLTLRRLIYVEKNFYLLNKFKIFEKRKKYSTNRIFNYVLFNK